MAIRYGNVAEDGMSSRSDPFLSAVYFNIHYLLLNLFVLQSHSPISKDGWHSHLVINVLLMLVISILGQGFLAHSQNNVSINKQGRSCPIREVRG